MGFLSTILFFKAFLGPGERWITVHPNGPGTNGQPVLVQPTSDGAMKVIGGAGGKLNHLRLVGVRSESEYKAEAARRAVLHKEERARRAKQDKEQGLTQSKSEARDVVNAAEGTARAKYHAAVAKAAGWNDEDIRFPAEKYANATPAARARAEARHLSRVHAAVEKFTENARKHLLDDAEARTEANLGEVKLTGTAPDTLTVQDLDPIEPSTKGLGFAPNYGERAARSGLTPADAKAEAAETTIKTPEQTDRAAKRNAVSAAITEELKLIREPGPAIPPATLIDAKAASDVLRARKEYQAIQREAKKKRKQIDASKVPVEPSAYPLEVGLAPVDADVVADLEKDLRTIRTRAFLDEAHKEGADVIQKHVAAGAYNAINALALTAGGAALVDRSVVDVLGIDGAVRVLARRLKSDLTPEEAGHVTDAMARYHVDHYMAESDEALREARSLHEAANEIELGEAATGSDFAAKQELNAKRAEFIGAAQKVLGTALGEMEANAELVVALKRPADKELTVSLGTTGTETAIRQARAIGLDRGDYKIERVGATTMMTVTGAGMNKLASPVARADLERVRGAMDIIDGRQDEDNWLPLGVANRPDLAMNVKPGTAARLAQPFPKRPTDMAKAVRDYIGGRAADGDTPPEIMNGLLADDVMQRSGDRAAFRKAVDQVAPIYDADGQMVRQETYQPIFDKLADDFVRDHVGLARAPLHSQKFEVDATSVDALHRVLAAHPEGVAAFKPIGELTAQDRRTLRDTFAAEYGRVNPAADEARASLEKLTRAEPPKEAVNMFGGQSVNPNWSAWKADRDAAAAAVNDATMTWSEYLDVMGSPANAYAAMQDVIKGNVVRAFADAHNTIHRDAPLKIGRTVIANDLNHLDALDPVAREKRLAEHRAIVTRLRNRDASGRLAPGAVADKLDAARAADLAATQAQMGLFGEAPQKAKDGTEAPPKLGERYTIGHEAERQIAGMMPMVGRDFRPGQLVPMWQPTMSGKYVGRQRAVKLIEHNRRTALGLGVGSGKTAIMLSSFTHLHEKGKAHRGLFLVPSVVQGQFHGEALTMLAPGKFNWHANPGAGRAERIAAYKDPKVNFNVVTHQAFRDDMLHLAAAREGTTPGAVATKLDGMQLGERAAYMADMMKAEGIDHDFLAVDEGHNLLNRSGKANSNLANVVDAVSSRMGTYVSATADPVKNDVSEAFDVLAKMDPARYSDRDAFMRKYGVNTAAAQEGLRREMVRHFYTGRIDPGVKVDKREVSVALSPAQHAQLDAIDNAVARGRLARMRGEVDTAAMRTLSPTSFEGVDAAHHDEVAKHIQASMGIVANTARLDAMNGGAKTEALVKIANERKGQPGVVFVHSLAHVKEAAERLEKEGHRIVTLTGADSSKEKDRKKRDFQEGRADIMISSDAGATGANLQRGRWLVQYDTPQTAMVHAQRQGRIARIGQKNNIELMDLVADHAVERRARKRLADKYELRDIMTSPMEGLDDTGLAGYLQRAKAGTLEAAADREPVADGEAPEFEPEAQGSML